MRDIEGGREPVGDVAIARRPGDLVGGVELSQQLRLLGSEPVDLSLFSNQILFPPIDLIRFPSHSNMCSV
ncbi:MAG TPA: hypothetical protein VJ796_01865 [Acidimicrobiia bacterium]|nr:hypothetical protein [Acidimicrobiia bacterium]